MTHAASGVHPRFGGACHNKMELNTPAKNISEYPKAPRGGLGIQQIEGKQ